MPLQIADRWFETRRIDDDITLLWEPHVIPLMRCNIWHVRGRDRDLLIDTGMGISSLKDATRHLIDKAVIAVATHTHADHVGSHYEFDDCLVHRLEADGLRQPSANNTLIADDFDPGELRKLRIAGYEIEGELITALPHAGYDMRSYRVRPARPTRIVGEGDIVDTGDRRFEILHLPGHSSGSIGLWEATTGILFSGDAIYDGPLLDELHHSSIADYIRTMRRLRALPVRVVHAGHDPSFGRDRLIKLVDAYLRRRDPGYASTAAA
jgi:glyoxylase-like metal-dependent hydrolase (beta-lactamase superfamily II)